MKKGKQSRSVEVFVEGKRKQVKVSGDKLGDVLDSLGFTPETMLVTVDGKITLPTSRILPGKIELFKVVSGG